MEALSFKSLRVSSPNNKLVWSVPVRKGRCLRVHCQGGGNVVKSVGFSSSSSAMDMERERPALADPGRAVMEAGSLVLSPNGTGENIAVKEMMPYGGTQSHSLVETDDGIGIGIVQFLRGKSFFITGATGFLAKGKHKY